MKILSSRSQNSEKYTALQSRTLRFGGAIALALFALSAWASQPVNINTASAQTIAESLNGVGMSKAQAIVDYRKAKGPFKHADELVNVKGIGLSTVDRNRDYIRLADGQKVASGN